MLFHVRRHEDTFSIQFALLDWDKVSGNDFIGSSTIPLADLISDAPKPDEKTGLYGPKEDGKHEMKEFRVSLWSVSMTTSDALCSYRLPRSRTRHGRPNTHRSSKSG